MSPRFNRLDGFSIFDDKGEVKRLVGSIIQNKDSQCQYRKYEKNGFFLRLHPHKKGRVKEVELARTEIEASWEWRKGNVDETLQKKIEDTLSEF